MCKIWATYGPGVSVMTSSSENNFSKNDLVNTNPHAKFGVRTTFGLGIR